MFFVLSIMNCESMLLPGAQNPTWTGYPLSGTATYYLYYVSTMLHVAQDTQGAPFCVLTHSYEKEQQLKPQVTLAEMTLVDFGAPCG